MRGDDYGWVRTLLPISGKGCRVAAREVERNGSADVEMTVFWQTKKITWKVESNPFEWTGRTAGV